MHACFFAWNEPHIEDNNNGCPSITVNSAIPVVLERAVHPHRRSQAPVSLEYYPNTKM